MSRERRTETREALVLPVLVGEGTHGVTRDVSESGLFVETGFDQLVDGVLEFEFLLDSANAQFKFVAQGAVLRHECRGQVHGVAVSLLAMRMEILA